MTYRKWFAKLVPPTACKMLPFSLLKINEHNNKRIGLDINMPLCDLGRDIRES